MSYNCLRHTENQESYGTEAKPVRLRPAALEPRLLPRAHDPTGPTASGTLAQNLNMQNETRKQANMQNALTRKTVTGGCALNIKGKLATRILKGTTRSDALMARCRQRARNGQYSGLLLPATRRTGLACLIGTVLKARGAERRCGNICRGACRFSAPPRSQSQTRPGGTRPSRPGNLGR